MLRISTLLILIVFVIYDTGLWCVHMFLVFKKKYFHY